MPLLMTLRWYFVNSNSLIIRILNFDVIAVKFRYVLTKESLLFFSRLTHHANAEASEARHAGVYRPRSERVAIVRVVAGGRHGPHHVRRVNVPGVSEERKKGNQKNEERHRYCSSNQIISMKCN